MLEEALCHVDKAFNRALIEYCRDQLTYEYQSLDT